MSMQTSVNIKSFSEDTRKSLLSTAGEVFAEFGFHAATVREICRRADVNVAAINYHFGSKEELYLQVLESAHNEAARKYPYAASKDEPPEKRLEGFILSFMQGFLDKGRASWHGKLMAREMVEPTVALKRMVERTIRPRNVFLTEAVREIMGGKFSDEEIARSVFSIIGQCLFYSHASAVIARLKPEINCGADGAGQTASHIIRFSLAALKHMPLNKKGVTPFEGVTPFDGAK
ncbi:MAG: CerR family C-terminal domain-containing protein [Deltaproteobacteria bacterium]|nr:CerR family C-terminal domain-containing protein [Deltaproteobacteria bacterium]